MYVDKRKKTEMPRPQLSWISMQHEARLHTAHAGARDLEGVVALRPCIISKCRGTTADTLTTFNPLNYI